MTTDPQVPPAKTPTAAGEPAQPDLPTQPPKDAAVRFTRTAAAWWFLALGLLILIVLLVFIAQNTDSITIHFLAWQWSSPLGVAFLLAAVGGALITLAAGTARMVQLRRAAKKNLLAPVPAKARRH